MLTRIAQLHDGATGQGFFLCTRREERVTRNGDPFFVLTLQDRSGSIRGKMFDDVARHRDEFSEDDFVKVDATCKTYQGVLELTVHRIRRVHAEQDRAAGFSEDDLIPTAVRPVDEMWQELQAHVARITRPGLRALVLEMLERHGDRLRVWPAARQVHHAYRGGLLEHVLGILRVVRALATLYDADEEMLIAGAILHDIGKTQELTYERSASYSIAGNLVGHIALGLMMLREAAAAVPDIDEEARTHLEHLMASHHGTRDKGSPVEPMSVEAMILSMADDLDARLNQVRRALAEDIGDEAFTPFNKRLGTVLYKGVDRV